MRNVTLNYEMLIKITRSLSKSKDPEHTFFAKNSPVVG
jgi:hypothetical protein